METFEKMAKYEADAVKSMNPDIRVWNTGNSKANPMDTITNVVQSMAPLLQGMQDQGGLV